MRRCTVTLPGGRRVHYRRHGCGPPLVLLHESPETSAAYVPLMEELGDRFTTIALDTPGRGDSDPLGLEQPEIADYAAATAEALVALGLGPVPVFGTHTGAMIALELACSFPELVAVAIVDGLPVFDDDEAAELAACYAPPLGIEADGSHLVRLWERTRDAFVWFPWYAQDDAHRLDVPPPPPPQVVHDRVLNVLRSGDAYRLTYGAAFRYRPLERLSLARAPLALTCRSGDLQEQGQARLPAGLAGEVVPVERWSGRIAEIAAAYAQGVAPPPPEPAGADPATGPPVGLEPTADGAHLLHAWAAAAAPGLTPAEQHARAVELLGA